MKYMEDEEAAPAKDLALRHAEALSAASEEIYYLQLDGRPKGSMAFGIVRNHDYICILCSNRLSYELNTYLTIL
jgi:hypothetical protein